MAKKSKIDKIRLVVLTSAELFDAWRTVPRLLVVGYSAMCWSIVEWYMNLQPYVIQGCDFGAFGDQCIVSAPSTQHAALVTAIVGGAAAVFGLYTNGGRRWSEETFHTWDKTNMQKTSKNKKYDDWEYDPNLPPDYDLSQGGYEDSWDDEGSWDERDSWDEENSWDEYEPEKPVRKPRRHRRFDSRNSE